MVLFQVSVGVKMEKKTKINKRQITIYDIAKEAGVSPSTVSRVMTNSATVRSATRERVEQLIDKYNFRPNPLARGLSEARSKVIGILVADVRNPYYSQMVVACEEAAVKEGYTVFLADSLDAIEREIEGLDHMVQWVDAIIQIGGSVDHRESNPVFVSKIKTLAKKTPIITTGKLQDGEKCYCIIIDDVKCVELLIEHLITLGHKDIAVIGGNTKIIATSVKLEHIKRLLKLHGISLKDENICVEGSFDYETGYREMNKILDAGNLPTAVIAINDVAAMGVMQSIREHGKSIPNDISVVSYDNTMLSTLANPMLTTIDYDYKLYGEHMVNTAIAAIEGREIERIQLIQPKLIIRDSTAAVKKK